MIKRLKKERITKLAKNTLSLIEIDVRTETSSIALHSKILNVLHGLVNQNLQFKNGESKPTSKAITSTASTDRVEPEEEEGHQPTPSEGGAKPKKPINKKKKNQTKPQDVTATAETTPTRENSGMPPHKMNNGPGNEKGYDKNYRSRPFKPLARVTPWPEHKEYISKSGNALNDEINRHFNGYCYRCGLNNHSASYCKTYDRQKIILTLCNLCRSGFHDVCYHPSFRFLSGGGGGQDLSSGYNTRSVTPAPSVKSVSSEPIDIEREVRIQIKKYLKKRDDSEDSSTNE